MSSLNRTYAVVATITAILTASVQSAQSQTLFARVPTPLGIAASKSGNLFVHIDKTTSHGLCVFNAAGVTLGYVQFGGMLDAASLSYLAQVPGSTNFLSLGQSGIIRLVDSNTGAFSTWLDLRQVTYDTSAIYDVSTKTYWNGGGMINPKTSTWGDISVLVRGTQIDVICSGISYAQVYPFQVRLRIQNNRLMSAKVMVTSRASTAGAYNSTRGVAVNSRGYVMTTLPLGGNLGTFDRLLGFSIDFPETKTGLPTTLIGGAWTYSSGMTTDSAGNFYIATGKMGCQQGGANGSGAILAVSADGGKVLKLYSFNTTLADSRDACFSPAEDRLYVSLMSNNGIYFFKK